MEATCGRVPVWHRSIDDGGDVEEEAMTATGHSRSRPIVAPIGRMICYDLVAWRRYSRGLD